MKFVTPIIVGLLTGFQVSSFTVTTSIVTKHFSTSVIMTICLPMKAATEAETDQYFEAVERAKDGMCSVEKLDRLAAELEAVADECKFENDNGDEACNKEIQDRLDIAEILRLRIELSLRLDHLKSNNNLFASDVQKEHDVDERRKLKESLIANREKGNSGSDLGLW